MRIGELDLKHLCATPLKTDATRKLGNMLGGSSLAAKRGKGKMVSTVGHPGPI